jgi:hypothetical protein
MHRESFSATLASSALALLLLLTAWGNAVAMFFAAALVLFTGFLLFREAIRRPVVLVTASAVALAILFVAIITLR